MTPTLPAEPSTLTINDPLHPPDAEQDDEADGIPGAPGPIGHSGCHHRGQRQDNHGPVKHLRGAMLVPGVLTAPTGAPARQALHPPHLSPSERPALAISSPEILLSTLCPAGHSSRGAGLLQHPFPSGGPVALWLLPSPRYLFSGKQGQDRRMPACDSHWQLQPHEISAPAFPTLPPHPPRLHSKRS